VRVCVCVCVCVFVCMCVCVFVCVLVYVWWKVRVVDVALVCMRVLTRQTTHPLVNV